MLSIAGRCPLCGFAALVVSSTLAGCGRNPSLDRDSVKPRPVPVKAVAVVEMDVPRTTRQPATVHAYHRAELRAQVSGYVASVAVDIGDFVQAGDSLAVIDVPELRKQREVVEARIARFESEEARAAAGVELADAEIRAAEAKLVQARSELERFAAALAAAEAEFDRTQDLVSRQSLERRMLDEARKLRDSALASRQSAQSAIQAAEAGVVVAQARRTAAQADVGAAQAETRIARRQLEEVDVMINFATIQAPFAGIVSDRAVDPGDLVRVEREVGRGQPLFVISQLDRVRVQIPVPEVDAALVSRGDAVSLRFPSFPDEQPIAASVTRFSGDLDASTRTMMVEVELRNDQGKLIPGMFGEASLTLSTHQSARMLPARAVRFGESGTAHVYVIQNDSTVAVTPVETGVDDGNSIEIVSGLEAGQQVVDTHLKRFTDGERVAPLPSPSLDRQ